MSKSSSSEQHTTEAFAESDPNPWPSASWDTGGDEGWTADLATHDPLSFLSGDIDKIYGPDLCTAALRGEKLPTTDVNAMSHVTRLCVLRGIRHHPGFAAELRDVNTDGQRDPAFTRALNARSIMSDEIPDISAADEVPYCIWHPDVASVDTYRELAKRYPQMRYQVGRACAVAGYSDLYRELQLLPDTAIAEDARDSVMRGRQDGQGNNGGSQDIFQHIVDQPVRWQVMDDYTRSVELEHPLPARYGLNGDTAVVSTLELKRSFHDLRAQSRFSTDNTRLDAPYVVDEELAPCYFNITEDWSIDEYTSSAAHTQAAPERGAKRPVGEEMQELLWNPLPADLPWGDKDLLILMAAYYGNVDRYARLRRPVHVSKAEACCIVRGIYHSTMFAKWWSLQPGAGRYEAAISARFIMNNDISRIADDTPDADLPRQIWYPLRAHAETYMELARRKPAMTAAVARALIVADHQEAWDRLRPDVEPYAELMEEARASTNPHYLEALGRSCAERGLDPDALEGRYPADLGVPVGALVERTATGLVGSPRVESVPWDGAGPAIYDGVGVDVGEVELFAAAPGELRPPEGFGRVDLVRLYCEQRHQPPSEGEEPESEAYRRRGQMPRRGGRGGGGGGGGGGGISWGNGRWAGRGRQTD